MDVDDERGVAWFDELLDNAAYGVFRGSGVLLLQRGNWRIAQYNLSFPVPNALLPGLAQQISGEQAAVAGAEANGEETSEGVQEPEPEQCRRKRHKTNTRAGC